MKKLIFVIALGILSTGLYAQRRPFTLKPYLFYLSTADTMYVTEEDRAFAVIVSVPDWATDSTTVAGLTGQSQDGHTTSAWTVAPGENISISWENMPTDSLTIITDDKVRIGLFKK